MFRNDSFRNTYATRASRQQQNDPNISINFCPIAEKNVTNENRGGCIYLCMCACQCVCPQRVVHANPSEKGPLRHKRMNKTNVFVVDGESSHHLTLFFTIFASTSTTNVCALSLNAIILANREIKVAPEQVVCDRIEWKMPV